MGSQQGQGEAGQAAAGAADQAEHPPRLRGQGREGLVTGCAQGAGEEGGPFQGQPILIEHMFGCQPD
jgi:hypothetical protein